MPASLSETAYYTRRAVKYAAIGLVVYLITYIFWSFIKPLIFKPAPPAPPGMELGTLPPLKFPDQQNLFQNLQFQLETSAGNNQVPTNLPDRGRVYALKVNTPQYLDLDQAKEIAGKLGFKDKPTAVSPSLYQWKRSGGFSGMLTMDIVNQSFDLVNDWRTDQHLLEERRVLDQERILSEITSYLQNSKIFSDDLAKGRQEFIYYSYYQGNLSEVESLSQADLVQVNFFRTDISYKLTLNSQSKDNKQKTTLDILQESGEQLTKIPIIPLNPKYPLVWGLVTAAKDDSKVIAEVHFHHQVIVDKFGEYPLIGVQSAWQQFTQGKGYITSIAPSTQTVVARDITLAYFEPLEPAAFLHPIYVFSGDNNFLGYIPALNYEEVK